MRRQATRRIRWVRSVACRALMMAAGGAMIGAAGPAPAPVAIRPDHPDLSPADARSMTPAALGDALLAPGHPPVVEATVLPEGVGPSPPPEPPIRSQVRLSFAATLDAPSGFCIKRSVEVVTMQPGAAQPETITPRTDYRLPSPGREPCIGRALFFSPAQADRPRAFEVVRLIAAAVRSAAHAQPGFPVRIDDEEDRERAQGLTARPDQRRPGTERAEVTDGRVALAAVPTDAIFFIGHNLDAKLLAPALLSTPHGPRER